jgi:hypothetical protein
MVYEWKGAGGLLATAVKQEYDSREYYGWYLQGRMCRFYDYHRKIKYSLVTYVEFNVPAL